MLNHGRFYLRKLLLALLCCFCATEILAQKYDASAFFRPDDVDDIKISPDGAHIAVTFSADEGSRMAIVRLQDRTPVASFVTNRNRRVGEFHWVNDERIIFSLDIFVGGFDTPFNAGEIYGLNIDDTQKFQLVGPTIGEAGVYQISHLIPSDPNNVRVVRQTVRRRSVARSRPESYLLDTYKRTTRLSDNLSRRVRGPYRWGWLYSDNSGEVRVAAAENDNGNLDISLLVNEEWVDIAANFGSDLNGSEFQFIGFSSSNEEIYYLHTGPSGTRALYQLDIGTIESRLVFEHPQFDISPGDMVYARDQVTIVGVKIMGDVFESHYFADSPDVEIYKRLDASFPGELVRITSATKDGNTAILGVFGPKKLGDFYLLTSDPLQLEPIMSRSSVLNPELMADVTPFAVRSVDGLTIHGYITRPLGVEEPTPMVVIPHGGPIGPRDRPLFNAEAQFLADNGYSVLHVNFRGSGGFGRAFQQAGHRQWGTGMIDDITQAVTWAVQKGYAQEDKICIYGGSYGAYAALSSVVREPDRYQCAVGYAGVYDLSRMNRSDVPWNPGGEAYLELTLGNDEELLKSLSPLYNTEDINVPVMLAHGGEDRRAPDFHARDLREALEDESKSVEWFYESGEGHGFYNSENRIRFYEALLGFLDKSLGR